MGRMRKRREEETIPRSGLVLPAMDGRFKVGGKEFRQRYCREVDLNESIRC